MTSSNADRAGAPPLSTAIDPLLLSVAAVRTARGDRRLTNATGFLLERDERLFLVTSRHVVLDEASDHVPDRLLVELHVDVADMARAVDLRVPLYAGSMRTWREGVDRDGPVDVAAIELQRSALPDNVIYRAFSMQQILSPANRVVSIGASLLIVGFPLGFHDTLHHLPVVRGAVVASSFGLRFQGKGYFLTDARTHRGTSGAPVARAIWSWTKPWA